MLFDRSLTPTLPTSFIAFSARRIGATLFPSSFAGATLVLPPRNCPQAGLRLAVVGTTANHVHLPVRLGPTCQVAEIMRKTKANSSRWLASKALAFEWQKRYGAFSVSPSMLLRKSGIAFEEKQPFA
jgi:hypothetical protein